MEEEEDGRADGTIVYTFDILGHESNASLWYCVFRYI